MDDVIGATELKTAVFVGVFDLGFTFSATEMSQSFFVT